MVYSAISSYSFGATALIFCRMFIHIMEVCISTGFWWSGGGIICVLQTHFIFLKSLLTKQWLSSAGACFFSSLNTKYTLMEKTVTYVYACRQCHTQFMWCRFAVLSFNLSKSCFVRSDFLKMKCVCKTQMMPPPDHQNSVDMHTSIMCINILQNIIAVAPKL
jgi:hypothetical protein